MSKSHPDIETIVKVFRSYCEVTAHVVWDDTIHVGEYAEARGKIVAGN